MMEQWKEKGKQQKNDENNSVEWKNYSKKRQQASNVEVLCRWSVRLEIIKKSAIKLMFFLHFTAILSLSF